MTKPAVHILVPTTRPSLEATLRSIVAAGWDGERVHVLAQWGDDVHVAEEIFDAVDPRVWVDGKPTWTFHDLGGPSGGWGHDSRNFALDNIVPDGAFVATVDDDDVLTPGALEAFADAAFDGAPVTVFRTTWGKNHPAHGVTLWRQEGLIARGEIATPMIFARRGKARWGVAYDGDFVFAQALAVEHAVAAWAWRDEVVCVVRP